jgi:hypothetical protein
VFLEILLLYLLFDVAPKHLLPNAIVDVVYSFIKVLRLQFWNTLTSVCTAN